MKELETQQLRSVNKILVDLAYYHAELNKDSKSFEEFLNSVDLTPANSIEDASRHLDKFGAYFHTIFNSVFALLNNP